MSVVLFYIGFKFNIKEKKMYLVDQKPWSIHLTGLLKPFGKFSENLVRAYRQKKQITIFMRLSDHQLKDIGFSQSDIYVLRQNGNWIDPLSTELHR
jgi:uncharacterized protein YjiS (DUF1127 family)